MRLALAVPVIAIGVGCATPRLDDPGLSVEIDATGLRQDEREVLRDGVCAIDGVSKCELVGSPAPAAAGPADKGAKGKRRSSQNRSEPGPPPSSPEAKITFQYRGSLGELRWKISALPHPGLEAKAAGVVLGYRGFDNKAPDIEIKEPADKTVVTSSSIHVVARVADVDTAEVKIGGRSTEKAGDLYSVQIETLKEGENPIAVKATDTAGNAGEKSVVVIVDTTPPDLQVEVDVLAYDKAVVRGKVGADASKITVDGRDVSRDLFGAFEREVAVDPDKSFVEIIAVDEHGNTKKIKRSVKIASPMSDQSAK